MNGVNVQAQCGLSAARTADVVLVGSGMKTREIAEDKRIMSELDLNSTRQLLGAQCSGTLLLAKLGLLSDIPACTDLVTKSWVQEAGIEVLNQPFHAKGNVATAGGCLASAYLAVWVIARTEGMKAAADALYYVAPVGEKDDFVTNALKHIQKYLPVA